MAKPEGYGSRYMSVIRQTAADLGYLDYMPEETEAALAEIQKVLQEQRKKDPRTAFLKADEAAARCFGRLRRLYWA